MPDSVNGKGCPNGRGNVARLLDRRERELEHQIAGLRGALKEKEAELADIVKARAAIPGTLGDAGRRQNALLGL